MNPKRIVSKLVLAGCVLAVLGILAFRTQIEDFFSFSGQYAETARHNTFYFASDEVMRRQPVSLLKKETELQTSVGRPFIDFDIADWREFWNLVYGSFPKDPPEREGLPKRERQLTEDELRDELITRYGEPFTYFQPSHWQWFMEVLRKKN
jgi:hypothetical protein